MARLRQAYQPEAASLCSRICNILDPSEDAVGDIGEFNAISQVVIPTVIAVDSVRRTLAFLGRLQYELASSSSFISTIGGEQKAIDGP